MTKKLIVIVFAFLLIGSNSLVFAQDKSERKNLCEFIESLKITGKTRLPDYNHQDLILQEKNEKIDRRRRAGAFLKSGRFWVLMAAVGGAIAGAILAITSDTDTRVLAYPSAAMGPLKKN